MPKILQHTVPSRSSLLEPQMAEQLVEVPGFEFVFVRRAEGALFLGVFRATGHTWAMRVHDTGDVSATMHDKFQRRRTLEVLLFSSSTEWWILPLCYRDRYAQCQTVPFWTGIDMPVVVHVKVVDNTVVAQRPFPMVQFSKQTTEILQLQSIDQVFDVLWCRSSSFPVQSVRRQSRSHRCNSLK